MLDTKMSTTIGDRLRDILGPGGVDETAQKRALYSQDIWAAGEPAELVASPTTLELLSSVIATAKALDYALAIRGAGMSYTQGYVPSQDRTILLDLSRMDAILAISPEDMTVTVQCGCTWGALHQALKPLGLRTPFWGPLSGLKSTIGGGISHYNAIYGAGRYGTSAESVVALTVVLADGRVMRTGAHRPGKMGEAASFYRFYGPDLTGLFTGDCGVFGVKAEITLRLIRAPAHTAEASFAFGEASSWIAAAAEIARSGVAAEMFGFDPNVARQRLKRSSLSEDVKTLGKVVRSGGSFVQGVKDAAKIAMAGRDFFGEREFTFHVFCEGRSQAGVAHDLAEARAVVQANGGHEIENSIARVLRADPFPPLNSVLGPNGERWTPVHGHVALSDAQAAFDAITAVFKGFASDFQRLEIDYGYLITTLSTNAFTLEPVFYWPDARQALHEATLEPAFLAKMPPASAPNPEAAAMVAKARQAVIDAFQPFGAVHHQIGRLYPYLQGRDAPSRELLESLKDHLDPDHRLNPGGLGL